MDKGRAKRVIADVAGRFGITHFYDGDWAKAGEEEICRAGALLGLSKRDQEAGKSPVPDALYKKYKIFDLLPIWDIAGQMKGRYGALRVLKRIFGETCQELDVPTEEEERLMVLDTVRPRCDQKVRQLNELFPGTFRLDLPVLRFQFTTNQFRSYKEVYELADAYDQVVERFSELFFVALKDDLPERQALEFNLLSSFLEAWDVVIPCERMTYSYLVAHRDIMKAEGFQQLSSYVRLRRVIPVWEARQFYSDPQYVVRYIATHEDAKSEIRRFLTGIGSYECFYIFIQDMAEHQFRQKLSGKELLERECECMWQDGDDSTATYLFSDPILVSKENGEITEEDWLLAEQGLSMVKSIRNGGARCRQKREYYNIVERMCKRLGIAFPADSDELSEMDFILSEEEGDCDE